LCYIEISLLYHLSVFGVSPQSYGPPQKEGLLPRVEQILDKFDGHGRRGPQQGQYGPPQGQYGPPQGQYGPPQGDYQRSDQEFGFDQPQRNYERSDQEFGFDQPQRDYERRDQDFGFDQPQRDYERSDGDFGYDQGGSGGDFGYDQGGSDMWSTGFPAGPTNDGLDMHIDHEWSEERDEKLRKYYHEHIANGRLFVPEVTKCMKQMDYHMTEDQAKWFISNIDRNGDGYVTYPEFRAGVQEYIKIAPKEKKRSFF